MYTCIVSNAYRIGKVRIEYVSYQQGLYPPSSRKYYVKQVVPSISDMRFSDSFSMTFCSHWILATDAFFSASKAYTD